jgi:8-oxo-dGTP diphosphatase
MKLGTLCYVKRDGRTLMLHRVKKENDMHQGKWTGLGGKLSPGETPEECVIREVREESGLVIRNPVLRGVLTFPAFDGLDDWYVFTFIAREFEGRGVESPEGELAWIEDDHLLELNLWAGDRIFLAWLEETAIFSARFVYDAGQLVRHDVVFYEAGTGRQVAPLPSRPRNRGAGNERSEQPGPLAFPPVYRVEDDTHCWVCDGPVTKRHCKITCLQCGFTRDCSDP